MEMEMGGFGAGIIIPLIVSLILVGIPGASILKKAGYSRAWVLLAFVPFVNLIAFWIFAFARWPVLRGR